MDRLTVRPTVEALFDHSIWTRRALTRCRCEKRIGSSQHLGGEITHGSTVALASVVVLALLAGIASVWAGDTPWLRLACAAGLVIGIAQQLVLLALSIRMHMLGTFWVRLSASTMLCAGVAC